MRPSDFATLAEQLRSALATKDCSDGQRADLLAKIAAAELADDDAEGRALRTRTHREVAELVALMPERPAIDYSDASLDGFIPDEPVRVEVRRSLVEEFGRTLRDMFEGERPIARNRHDALHLGMLLAYEADHRGDEQTANLRAAHVRGVVQGHLEGEPDLSDVYAGWPAPDMETAEPAPFEPVLCHAGLGVLAHHAVERAGAIGTTVPSVALALATSALAAVSRRVVVQLSPTHREPAALYSLAIGSSGSRKSALRDVSVAPLEAALRERRERGLARRRHHDAERARRERELEQRAAKGEATVDDYADLGAFDASRPLEPLPSLDDATPEAILAKAWLAGGRALLAPPEAIAMLKSLGRYSNGVNLGPLLQGHAGEMVRVTRKSGEDREMPGFTLNVITMGQPAALRELVNAKAPWHGYGLEQRFAISPHRLTASRSAALALDGKWSAIVEHLVAFGMEGRRDGAGLMVPDAIPVERVATEALDEFNEEQRRHVVLSDAEASLRAKAAGLAARLALAVAMVQRAAGAESPLGMLAPLEVDHVDVAIVWADYLTETTLAHWSAFTDSADDAIIARLAQQGSWTMDEIRRTMHRAPSMKRKSDREATLARLVERGIVRRRKERGRNGAEIVEVNPCIRQRGSK